MIKLKNISKSYGRNDVIKDYSLEINAKDFIIIYGASGSGKTTLLNLIGSLENPDKGVVEYVDSGKVYNTTKHFIHIRKNFVSYIFQNFALLQKETVLDNLMFALKESGLDMNKKSHKINAELNKVNLQNKANSYIYELSGGEQQRIALARAIVKPHSVILADEPTGNLDKENAKIVMDYLQQLNNNGETIIIVSHDETLKTYANKIVYLK